LERQVSVSLSYKRLDNEDNYYLDHICVSLKKKKKSKERREGEKW